MTEVENVYVQHLTALGDIAPGWPVGGVQAALGDLVGHRIAPDGQGGLFVVWPSFPAPDVFLQRLDSNGAIHLGWPAEGVPVCRAPGDQLPLDPVGDGAGGAIVVWGDWRGGDGDIYAAHILADGTLAPGWPKDGLAICAAPYEQLLSAVVADGAGGFYAAWQDARTVPWELYMVRIHGDGMLAPGWQPNGTLIWGGPLYESPEGMVPDGAGGVYVLWTEGEYFGSEIDIFLQRVDQEGAIHPGWPARGVAVCTAPSAQYGSQITQDGVGGVVLSWDDYRAYAVPGSTDAADVYALRVRADGTRAAGWPENGRIVSGGYGFQFTSMPVPDGAGGVYIAFERYGTPTHVYAQHLTGSGAVAPGWPEIGLPVAPGLASGQDTPRIAADGLGGAIAVWRDHRRFGFDIYAQKFVPGGPTPVLVSLVSVDAAPDRVALTWHRAAGEALEATVYRRREPEGWLALGRADFDASGRLRFEDRAVVPGARYAYRVGVVESGSEWFGAETWVEVPRALALALEGLRPNPAVGDLTVSFALPSAAPAALELLDVAGRRLLHREVGSLGAGRHLVRLDPDRRLAPGIYWLRLTQAGRSLRARGVVVR